MKRTSILIYGILSYAIFFATFLFALGWIGGFGVPRTVDLGPEASVVNALWIDLGLLALFALQHSVMARPGFKRWLVRFIPRAAERSTYVLASSLAMIALFYGWRPIQGTVWSFEDGLAHDALFGVYLLGPALVLYSTFLIDHFDLFGLRQVVLHFRNIRYTDKQFVTPGPYKYIRHPLYVGWFVTFWATPSMSLGHLLLAVGTTAYILVAIYFEERDLGELLGSEYKEYRARTPMFIPRPASKRPASAAVRLSADASHGTGAVQAR